MLQSNLIGRQFNTEFGKTKYTIVAVYLHSGTVWVVGESDGADGSCPNKGRLIERRIGEVTLI